VSGNVSFNQVNKAQLQVLPNSPWSCKLSRMPKIFCEASSDMLSNRLILREDTSGATSCGDSKIFFKQQKSSGLVTTTIVLERVSEYIKWKERSKKRLPGNIRDVDVQAFSICHQSVHQHATEMIVATLALESSDHLKLPSC
jgi:hypothetical protein